MVMCGELTRFGQRVAGIVIFLKELKDGSSFVKGVLSLASSNSRLPGKDSDLNPHHTMKTITQSHYTHFCSLKYHYLNHIISIALN